MARLLANGAATDTLDNFYYPAVHYASSKIRRLFLSVNDNLIRFPKIHSLPIIYPEREVDDCGIDISVHCLTIPSNGQTIYVVTLAIGSNNNVLGLTADGKVYAWCGVNAPVLVDPGPHVVFVTIAIRKTLCAAVSKEGNCYCWTITRPGSLSRIPELKDIAAISVGNSHILALSTFGLLYISRLQNTDFQLGRHPSTSFLLLQDVNTGALQCMERLGDTAETRLSDLGIKTRLGLIEQLL